MALPWARLDTNIASHDKILDLLGAHDDGRAIAFVYVCCIAYSVGHGTDGFIPRGALTFVHGSKTDMEALVDAGLLAPHPRGWLVCNFEERQVLSAVSEAQVRDKKRAGAKGNCRRWHEPGCECWKAKSA